jgi:hypothetical protein
MKTKLLCLLPLFAFCSFLAAETSPVQAGTVLDIRGAYIQLEEGEYVNFRIINRKLCVFYLDQDFRIKELPEVKLSVRMERARGTKNRQTRVLFKDDSNLFFTHPQDVRAPWDNWIWPIVIYPDESVLALPRTRFRQQQGSDTFDIEDDI